MDFDGIVSPKFKQKTNLLIINYEFTYIINLRYSKIK